MPEPHTVWPVKIEDLTDPAFGLFGVFGDPIAHSLSPTMQNAALAACGIKGIYLAFRVSPQALPAAVAGIGALGFRGVNVTIPHKQAVIPLLDETVGDASLCGSVNTIVVRDGRLVGYSTDGEGFLRSLYEETGMDPAGKKACLLGSGGAAVAIALSLKRAGVRGLVVVTRRKRDLAWPQALADLPVEVLSYEEVAAEPKYLAQCELIVNTTPLGMEPWVNEMPPVPASVFRPGMVVYDLIYRPARTRLMEAAEKAGARAVGGLGMLVHQGALSFELWTGISPPIEVMRRAVTTAQR